jgi:hypothetical protein
MSIRAQNKLFEDKQTKKDDENKIQEIESKVNEIEALKVPDIAEHFEWHINFSEVFQEKGGFDIVIGNPPYVSAVQNSKSDSNFREVYRKQYPLIKGAFDIYVIFLIKGVEIINTKGSFTWIVPNKLLVAIYAENVLEYLKQNGLGTIVSISSIKVFEAGVYPIIILGNKTFDFFLQYEANTLQQFALNNFNTRYEYKEKYQTFSELGIKAASGTTGFQAKQIIKYMSEFSKKTAIPFVVSGSIDPYLINFRDIRYMNKLYRHAFIIKGAGIADSKWKLWNNEKIVIAGMTKRIEATYAEEPLAIGVGVYAIYEYGMFNPKFLLALLNSKFLSHYITIQFKEKHLAGGYLAINKATIERLPIVPANHNMQELLSGLANKILAITKGDDYLQNSNKQAQVKEYEKQIDQLVYKLYNLTDEEINIIEKT